MPRRREVPKRVMIPDPRYGSQKLARFINKLMLKGKKSTAERIMYGAMDLIADRTSEDPLKLFEKALDNARPMIEVKSRRVGGSTYQVPVEIRPERRQALAMRWLINYSRARGEKTMAERLANELMDAASGRGTTVKKKEDTHRMAEANKAFAHYRW
ncbi:MAG: 30S ribosomal protein S7 [Desulfarculus sp.]|nr:30S ribosomal protein S7 [Pseudomonadota bacterium]MBV1717261.1 30S ribosomal protein S7 [Desulfarculus sp.]MCG2763114.1 30S ribosomal protein S7 [Desulfarculaceae bacterium]MBU4575320.1 30S ribosomal protein S7 [Pseudomonadota bacterium]MBU4599498.1 30S ribosomal protein S7 [Pseudomonadota bacterium]